MIKFIVAGVIALGLSGCVSSQQQAGPSAKDQRKAQEQAAIAECNRKAQSKQFTTMADYSRCIGAAETIVAPDMGEYADLLHVRITRRTALFERVDRGEITLAQAQAELAQVNSNLMGELHRRSAVNQAAIDRRISAIQASSPVTCTKFAYSVTCY